MWKGDAKDAKTRRQGEKRPAPLDATPSADSSARNVMPRLQPGARASPVTPTGCPANSPRLLNSSGPRPSSYTTNSRFAASAATPTRQAGAAAANMVNNSQPRPFGISPSGLGRLPNTQQQAGMNLQVCRGPRQFHSCISLLDLDRLDMMEISHLIHTHAHSFHTC